MTVILVKGVSSGNTLIIATAASGVEASYPVTVKYGPATFTITATATCVDKNHVGNNWTKEFCLDGESFSKSTTFKAELGQTISLSCLITENDSNPDSNGFTETLEMTEDIFKNGYVLNETVWVHENGGRYSGNAAEWSVKITIRKKSN